MTIHDQVKDEKLQYDSNREAAKILPLSSGKIDKYEYLTGEEILPSNQKQIVKQTKFTYSLLGKAFKEQTEKQMSALNVSDEINEIKKIENIFPKNILNELIRDKLKNY